VFIPGAHAEKNGDAIKTLKAMSDYIASQKTLSITFDSDVEVITSDLQKIQFTSSGQVQLSRPNELHATRTGGYTDVEVIFDGKMLTVNGKDKNVFAQLDSPGSVDQLIGMLRDKYSVAAPGGDLYRIYLVCRDYNIDYNVAYIPAEFQNVSKTMFDPIYMTALFDLGYQQGSSGYRWRKDPPGF
jgi:hypothetical protein